MQKRQIIINAVMSVAQVVILSVVLFILYGFLLKTIGPEGLGIWSVVLATTSVVRIVDLGLSSSVVKFVAKYLARGETESVSDLIQTVIISVAVLIGFTLLVGYPFASWLLGMIVPGNNLPAAVAILPYALVSLWMMMIASVFQAALDGYQRIDIRSMLMLTATILYLLLCFILAPRHGLLGLAYAQILQALILVVGSWIFLKRSLLSLPVIPRKWNRSLFKEVVGYGVNFQIASVAQMLYDPTTKALLTKFGGLTMVAYYEMASRMVLQLRSLIVSAHQVLVPAIADLQERKPETIKTVYKDCFQFLLFLAPPFYSVIVAATPVISELWIGHYESTFVLFSILLALGWFISTLNVPAYFASLGIGEGRWVMISHVVIGLLNGALGFLIGRSIGSIAVVVAWAFSLAVGSHVVTFACHHKRKLLMRDLITTKNMMIALTSGVGAILTLFVYYQCRQYWSLFEVTGAGVALFGLIVGVPMWIDPMRKRVVGWIGTYLLKAGAS